MSEVENRPHLLGLLYAHFNVQYTLLYTSSMLFCSLPTYWVFLLGL